VDRAGDEESPDVLRRDFWWCTWLGHVHI
jgi:hypothetical protein